MESEERYRSIHDHSPISIEMYDAQGALIQVNRACQDLFGVVDPQEIRGFSLFDNPNLRDEWKAALRLGESVRYQGPYDFEKVKTSMLYRTSKSGIMWLDVSIVPLKHSKGSITGFLVQIQDISEQKRVIDALSESEEKFRTLAASTPTAILLYQDDKWLYANPAAEAMCGYTLSELQTMHFWEFVHPDHRSLVQERGRKRQAGQDTISRYEFKIVSKDGAEKWVDLAGASTHLNGRPAGIISVTDITARKQSEEKLLKSETRYRCLIEGIQDSVYVLDRNWRYVIVNEAASKSTGVPKDRLLGKKLTDLFPEIEDTPFFETFQHVMITRKSDAITAEYGFGDRPSRWYEVRVYPVPEGILCVSRDVTDLKRAEEEIHHNEKRLESLLKIAQLRGASIQELLNFALEEAISLTRSKIGYIYLYDDVRQEFRLNTWSKNVMKECTIPEPTTVYSLKDTGIWAEPVRQARPIVLNDFQAPHPLKKGYPEGHPPLRRYLSLPVFSNDRIVAVTALANKETDYTESDLRQLTLLMDSVWRIAAQREALEAMVKAEKEYRNIFENAQEGIFRSTPEGRFILANRAMACILGYDSPEELIATVTDASRQVYTDPEERANLLRKIEDKGSVSNHVISFRRKNGQAAWLSLNVHLVRDDRGRIRYYEGMAVD
jgi:PAS domain S-box-containing protein